MKRNLQMTITVFLLFSVDQLVKIYIAKFLMKEEFYIIDHFLGFKPYQNTKYSWINSLGNFGVNLLTHIILSTLLVIAILIVYDFINYKYKMYRVTFILMAFLFAGAFCSLIDKVVWKGSLDYILLEGLFIFDLKDVYLTIFEVLLIMLPIVNYKGFRDISGRKVMRDFKQYVRERYSGEEVRSEK